ncbi:helix-turn-helix domain-containing protein [Nonomuraea sp. NPDC049158]|uniref:helix-turn-helix domain-containing protein n=1 Tax=Nonomuraea sp. NPDC049158 TaxID=3155649 RepID=UPI0033DA0372
MTETERARLHGLTAEAGAVADRARIVLACADSGVSNAQVARDLGMAVATVRRWQTTFARDGMDALSDRPRSGRPKAELTVNADERATLQRWARRTKSAQILAMRSKIVLGCADGKDNQQIAAELRVHPDTVSKWRSRRRSTGRQAVEQTAK